MRWAVLRGSPARRPISLNGRRGSLREKDARTRIALRRDLRPEPWEPRRLGNFRIVESYPGIWKRYARNRASVKGQSRGDAPPLAGQAWLHTRRRGRRHGRRDRRAGVGGVLS